MFSKELQTSKAAWDPLSSNKHHHPPNTDFWFMKLWNVVSCQLGSSFLKNLS